ncbi:hypothetical protein EU527_16325 [Candidatus Thorarchaeota archaeon]|nr:MAG: hypothetical protein EU527_16325 [Candidatus Thorarchaeota archaeon]
MVVPVSRIGPILSLSLTMNQTETSTELSPWNDIIEFLRPILNPLVDLWENYALRVSLLSTIIWSFLIICGLVFLVYEGGTILPLILGTKPKQVKRTTQSHPERRPTIERATPRQRISSVDEKKDVQRTSQIVDETGVQVISKIQKHYDKLLLNVDITNGSDSKIDMVVVDLDLPPGIETDIGFFRMQRIGSINSGQTESIEFTLKSMGGNPESIGGYVEFLGASYEVSKVLIPSPKLED